MASSQASQDDSVSKYAHLLQPIRDLASNWDVNIADELEDYLEVLEAVKFSFEDGPSLNFAEAALVIQGSACVYSKKVEYLHKLVYEALECIEKKRQRESTSKTAAEADVDDEFDDEETFLNLDDVLEEGQGIDLNDDGDSGQVEPGLRPPAALLAMDDGGREHGDGGAGHHWVSSFSMHMSGALLLESRDGDTLDVHLRRTAARVTAEERAAEQSGATERPAPEQPQGDVGAGSPVGDDGDPGGWDDAGPAYDDDGDDGAAQWDGGPDDGGVEPQQVAVVEAYAEFDPWAPLDMHDPGTLLVRPFRKGRRLLTRRKAAAPQSAGDASGLWTAVPPVPLGNGLAFPEFAAALKARLQAKAVERAAVTGRRRALPAHDEDEQAHDDGLGDEDNDNDGDGYDCGYEPADDGDDDELPLLACEPEELERLAAAGTESSLARYSMRDDAGGEPSYEDMCKAHIEAFINAAAAAEVQTELASRVAGWRAKILPIVEEQDARDPFDIHVYGDCILTRLTQLRVTGADAPLAICGAAGPLAVSGKSTAMVLAKRQSATGQLPAPPVELGKALADEEQWRISRLFTSMLQLINGGNVTVLQPALEDAPLQLQLLSLERHHEQMFCFKAPSLHEKGAVEMSQADDSTAALAPAADVDENAARPAAVKATKRRKASKR